MDTAFTQLLAMLGELSAQAERMLADSAKADSFFADPDLLQIPPQDFGFLKTSKDANIRRVDCLQHFRQNRQVRCMALRHQHKKAARVQCGDFVFQILTADFRQL